MNDLKYLRGLDEESGFMGRGGKKYLERAFGFLFIVILAGLPVGCLVGSEEYDQAARERDEYHNRLQTMRLSNDQLNKDIAVSYAECDALNSQLSILAALSIHDKYTDGLRRAEPAAASTPAGGRNARTTNSQTSTVTTTRPTVNPDRRNEAAQRGSGSQKSGAQQPPAGGGQRGGATTTTAPPPPPPSGAGGGGAIDWGL